MSRQFVLPKLTAKGQLLETKVPRAMFDKPATSEQESQYESGEPQEFFGGKQSIGSILQQRKEQQAKVEEMMPELVSSNAESKPNKILIQELDSPTKNLLTCKVLPKAPFSFFSVEGCSNSYAMSAVVAYDPLTHKLLLSSSKHPETLLIPITESRIPKTVEAFYSESSGSLRVLLK